MIEIQVSYTVDVKINLSTELMEKGSSIEKIIRDIQTVDENIVNKLNRVSVELRNYEHINNVESKLITTPGSLKMLANGETLLTNE
jgi:hypothetical protein